MAQGVHFVGSIPLNSTEDVFSTVLEILPGRVRRISDGEIGKRSNFIGWQKDMLPEEVLAVSWREDGKPGPGPEAFKCSLENIKEIEYDQWAISSYHTFLKLRSQGIIPPGIRFQVSLPTPINVIGTRVDARWQKIVEPLYEQRISDVVKNIQKSIPNHDLAIQWDMAIDIAILEFENGRLPQPKPWFSPTREGILDRIKLLTALVNDDVEMGFHLCYGDYNRAHFIQPIDLGLLTGLANDIVSQTGDSRVKWFHMPVPRDRKDANYFQPLGNLEIGDAQLFLGLVHGYDIEGTRERISAAKSVYKGSFGVATECGMGRMPTAECRSILGICASVASPY